jgi:hypothetical protein
VIVPAGSSCVSNHTKRSIPYCAVKLGTGFGFVLVHSASEISGDPEREFRACGWRADRHRMPFLRFPGHSGARAQPVSPEPMNTDLRQQATAVDAGVRGSCSPQRALRNDGQPGSAMAADHGDITSETP